MRRAPVLALAALLLSGCGLPVPDAVQSAGEVRPQRAEPAPVEVLPPGPQAGASPAQVVAGFLNAQSSPDDDHAVARQFLAPDTDWDDEAGAVVYELGSLRFAQDPADPTSFAVRVQATGRISSDGAFSLLDRTETAAYSVARQPDGEFRLVKVPSGLLLTRGDRDRSFTPYEVYFLALAADGSATARLVPDRVFLPDTAEPAQALVNALLSGATDALLGAVESAALPGTQARTSVTDGIVTVELSEQALELDTRGRQRLAAQLVWTLTQVPGVTGVRLLAGGTALPLPGTEEVQDRGSWAGYDPVGPGSGDPAPVHYIRNRVLRTLTGPALPDAEVTRAGGLEVDEVAVSPVGGTLAAITRSTRGDVLRTGPVEGPLLQVLAKRALRSPTWGSGTQGVWLIETGPRPLLWRVPPSGPAQVVRYPQPSGAGPLTGVQVSRDGARIAMVFGAKEAGRLYVGRIEPVGGGFTVTGADRIAPDLVAVTDVGWQSGTSLVVLASRTAGARQLLLWTVPVDGSSGPTPVPRQGLTGVPESLAAMPGQPLVVAARIDGRSVLFRESGALLLQSDQGGLPVYPG